MSVILDSVSLEISEMTLYVSGSGDKRCSMKQEVRQCPGLQWWIECFPCARDSRGNAYLGFTLNFSKPVDVKFTASIVGTGYTREGNFEVNVIDVPNVATYTIDALRFISRQQLYAINGNKSVKLFVTVDLKPLITNPFPALTVAEGLLDDDSMVTLSVDGKNVKINKALLMNMSPVFDAMFTLDTKEAAMNCVEITDFDFITVQTFVDYCNGRPPARIPTDLLIELMWFADKYVVLHLTAHMEKYLLKRVTADNVLRVATYAATKSRDTLLNVCLRCYSEKFRSLARAPEEASIDKFMFSKVFSKRYC